MIIAQHTLETTALSKNIWALWVDASGYKKWDERTEWAKLKGEFKVGTRGELKPKGGFSAVFTITEMKTGRSFTYLTLLPFAQLRFHHAMEPTDLGTRLTHRIEVKGFFSWIWARLLGPAYRKNLPAAMRKLARLAEWPSIVEQPGPVVKPK